MIIRKKNEYYLIPKPKNLYGIKCFNCRKRVATEEHHVLGGRKDRWKAEEDGLTVGLCDMCHWLAHNKPIESGIYYKLKKVAQRVYEKTHTRKEWMNRYHKNYLWDEE